MAIGTHDLDTLEGPFTYEVGFGPSREGFCTNSEFTTC